MVIFPLALSSRLFIKLDFEKNAGGSAPRPRRRTLAARGGTEVDEPERDPAPGERHDHPEGHPGLGQPERAVEDRLPGMVDSMSQLTHVKT